jgi:hypothetical protein
MLYSQPVMVLWIQSHWLYSWSGTLPGLTWICRLWVSTPLLPQKPCVISFQQLTPWRQFPNIHHHIHKSLPPVHILSQLIPLPPSHICFLRFRKQLWLPWRQNSLTCRVRSHIVRTRSWKTQRLAKWKVPFGKNSVRGTMAAVNARRSIIKLLVPSLAQHKTRNNI